MKVKIVADEKERRKVVRELFHAMDTNCVLPHKKMIVLTVDLFPKIFSAERLRILQTLKKQQPESITELAAMLQRPFESVHRDVKALEEYGLISLTKEKRSVIPVVAGKVQIEAVA